VTSPPHGSPRRLNDRHRLEEYAVTVNPDGSYLLDAAAIAAYVGIAERGLLDLVAKGRIPHYWTDEQTVRFRRSEVDAWLAEQENDPVEDLLRRTRDDRGLPRTVTDPEVIERVAAIIVAASRARRP
jgi:excisionase family DNA binding protein